MTIDTTAVASNVSTLISYRLNATNTSIPIHNDVTVWVGAVCPPGSYTIPGTYGNKLMKIRQISEPDYNVEIDIDGLPKMKFYAPELHSQISKSQAMAIERDKTLAIQACGTN